jgi:pilus assembly protein CpaB
VLRRTQSVATKAAADSDTSNTSGNGSGGGNGIGAMRAEILRRMQEKIPDPALMPEEEEEFAAPPPNPGRSESDQPFVSKFERNLESLRPRVHTPRMRIRPSRLILIGVALFAGGIAGFLALMQNQPPAPVVVAEPVTEVVQAPTAKVLVARQTIGVGQKLSPEVVEWVEWPEAQLRSEYITDVNLPDAVTELTGDVVRGEFLAGEPIREQKLVDADGGFLSALLEGGLRGVSVAVTADAASGGFIIPNDHVDVVLTQMTVDGQESETILRNVLVLGINSQLSGAPPAEGEAEGETSGAFANQAIATLALDPTSAEVIINAAQVGKLTLVLRSMVDTATGRSDELDALNQAIRMTSAFWRS